VDIPAEVKSVSVQLFGCPATGSNNADVKAFLSLDKPEPTQWDAQWMVSWCSSRPLIVPRAELPAERHTMHVSVYSQRATAYKISIYDVPKLALGEAHTHALNCTVSETMIAPPLIRSHEPRNNGAVQPMMECGTFSLAVPPDAEALSIRIALKDPAEYAGGELYDGREILHKEYARQVYQTCPMRALLSLTASNLTAFPASYALSVAHLNLGGNVEDSVLIPRT
jgi:hypothetical protein